MADLGRINGRTGLIGLIATPISHSLSPAMHNIAFQKLGLNYVYLAFEVGNDQLTDVVRGLRALNSLGFNISMPNKAKIIPLLDEVTTSAQLVGAVNTVVNENGKFIGYNTDGMGYVLGLREAGVDIQNKRITLLGAGGAATAVAIQAALDGANEISIFNRADSFFSKAERNAEIINEHTSCKARVYHLENADKLREAIAESDILTNATSVGMKPEGQSLIPEISWLRSDLIVSDVIYYPRKTKLLEQAEFIGCKTINGLGMMLWQGAKAFELWIGQQMPVEYVKERLFLKNS